MPWFKVDDQFHGHPKAKRAGKSAVGIWCLAGSYCMAYKEDGHVDPEWVRDHRAAKEAAALVTAGLWHQPGHDCPDCPQPRYDGGYVFHDWADTQPTADEIEKNRAMARERQRKLRERRAKGKDQQGEESDDAPVVRLRHA